MLNCVHLIMIGILSESVVYFHMAFRCAAELADGRHRPPACEGCRAAWGLQSQAFWTAAACVCKIIRSVDRVVLDVLIEKMDEKYETGRTWEQIRGTRVPGSGFESRGGTGICSHSLPVSYFSSIFSMRTSRTTLSTDWLRGGGEQGAVRRGAVRRGAVRCGAARCGAVRRGAVRRGAARRGAARRGAGGAARCGVLRRGAAWCGARAGREGGKAGRGGGETREGRARGERRASAGRARCECGRGAALPARRRGMKRPPSFRGACIPACDRGCR